MISGRSTLDALYGSMTGWLAVVVMLLAGTVSSMATEAQLFEIYESRSPKSFDGSPISVRVPAKLVFSKPSSSKVLGINILTYYPSFASSKDPGYEAFGLGCVGICNGRILIGIENRTHSINLGTPNMGDWMAKSHLRRHKAAPYRSNIELADLDAKVVGFTEAFEVKTKDPASGHVARLQKFYLRKTPSADHYDLAAACAEGLVMTGCTLQFSLRCMPSMFISVGRLNHSDLHQANDIKDAVDQFISKMVIDPSCSK